MTDLTKAIAEMRRAEADVVYIEVINEVINEVWNVVEAAVLSGEMIPATERDAAVADALEEAVKKSIRPHSDTARKKLKEAHDKNDHHGATIWSSIVAHLDIVGDAILALINRPQADALARVRAEAVKVKPLVWVENPDAGEGGWLGGCATMNLTYHAMEDGWSYYRGLFWRDAESITEAKAAAQADHDARIRAAIEGVE